MTITSIESTAQGHGITQRLPASKVSAAWCGNATCFKDIGKLAAACPGALRHLQQDCLLEVNRRRITIRNLKALSDMDEDILQGKTRLE